MVLLELARTERSAGARASTPSVPFILSGPRGPWFERPGSSKGTDLDAVRSTLRPNGVERKAPARTSPSWRQPPCRDQRQTETPPQGGEAPPHPAGRAPYYPPTPPPAEPLGPLLTSRAEGPLNRPGADCAVGSGEWAEPPHSPWTLRHRGPKRAIFCPFSGSEDSAKGALFGPFLAHFWPIFGPFWALFWPFWGPFLALFWPLLALYPSWPPARRNAIGCGLALPACWPHPSWPSDGQVGHGKLAGDRP